MAQPQTITISKSTFAVLVGLVVAAGIALLNVARFHVPWWTIGLCVFFASPITAWICVALDRRGQTAG